MLKEFITKQLLKNKLKDLPEEQRNMIKELIEKNPKLFEEIGHKIKAKVDGGMNEMLASMSVMREYQGQIQALVRKK